jgi:hypothetical protein
VIFKVAWRTTGQKRQPLRPGQIWLPEPFTVFLVTGCGWENQIDDAVWNFQGAPF